MVSLTRQLEKVVQFCIACLAINYIVFSDEVKINVSDLKASNTTLLEVNNENLLNKTGSLNETGWYPHPFKVFSEDEFHPVNFGFKPMTFLKYKQFEKHAITSNEYMIFFAFAVNGNYSGSVFLTIYNWYTNEIMTDKITLMPWQMSYLELNALSSMKFQRTQNFSKDGLVISYNDHKIQKESYIRREYKIESKKLNLKCEFFIELKKNIKAESDSLHELPKDEGYLMAQKIDDTGNFWSLGYKHYGINVNGAIEMNKTQKEKMLLTKESEAQLMVDYGVGLYPYKTHWVFCFANFIADNGDKMAINFADGVAKTSTNKAQENYMVINGKVSILEPADIIYDANNISSKPWRVKTRTPKVINRKVFLDFVIANKVSDTTNFGVVKNKLVQNIGLFNGYIIDENNKTHEFDDVKGFCEFNYVQW